MIAVVGPPGTHPVGVLGIGERVVKWEQWYAVPLREERDQRVEPSDVAGRASVAVVPGEHVDDRDTEAEPAPVLHHSGEVRDSLLHRTPLDDVVDSALHDENVRTARRILEPRCDLIGALAVDTVVAQVERLSASRGPPLPLAALIGGRADPVAHGRIRVPERGARSDRVTEAGDDGHARKRLGVFGGIALVGGVRWASRGKDAGRPDSGCYRV